MSNRCATSFLMVLLSLSLLGCGAGIPSEVTDAKVWTEVIKHEYKFALWGLIAGVVCIAVGVLLIVNGVAGTASLTAKVLGLDIALPDAPIGVILMALGVVIIKFTKFDIKVVNNEKGVEKLAEHKSPDCEKFKRKK